MRSIRQILYYRLEKQVSADKTARALQVSKGTVVNTTKRFAESGLPWPLPEDITDSLLELRLYPAISKPKSLNPDLPGIADLEQELAKKHVTLQCLYDEYRDTTVDPVSRASFYRYYQQGRVTAPSMPMEYRGGDLVYVDYSGDGLSYMDSQTGERIEVDLFCCCWGLSSHSYADATESQKKRDFTQSHVRALRYFGVSPHGLVPDNLKSAVQKYHPFDPQLNPLYEEFARHYNIAVLPARISKPKDKAKIESGVLHIQRFILARLRNRQFFSLGEINKAIAELLEEFNERPMKDYGYQSRRERFERLDRPYAQPLPTAPFRVTDVKHNQLVGKNYHVRYENHYYSVPFKLCRQRVTVKRNGMMVELIHDNLIVTKHLFSTQKYRYTTRNEHMPSDHQFVKGLTPGWIIAQAAKIGENTVNAVTAVMRRCEHIQQGFNAALGVLSFAKAYSPERLEAACRRCLHYNSVSYQTLKSVLACNLDQQPLPSAPAARPTGDGSIIHENLRRDFRQNNNTKEQGN
jgi:transposase